MDNEWWLNEEMNNEIDNEKMHLLTVIVGGISWYPIFCVLCSHAT